MKKFSIHIYVVLGLFLTTFIIGSFVDLQLSQAIFSRGNGFGIFMSAIGTIPGYGCLPVIGGLCLALGLDKKYKTLFKVIFFVGAVAALGLGIYFSGREFFGENGFYGKAPVWVGYLIALPIMGGLEYFGYFLGKRSDNPHLWIVLIIISVAIFFALIPGVTALKSIFHRPRYRMITREDVAGLDFINFHSWWQPTKNYKEIITQYADQGITITKEEFKSFPSGHAGASSVFMLFVAFLPYINSNYTKYRLPLFYAGLAWALLISFTRILVGAHFLSDVSMGGILTALFLLIGYIVVTHLKILNPQEQIKIEAQE